MAKISFGEWLYYFQGFTFKKDFNNYIENLPGSLEKNIKWYLNKYEEFIFENNLEDISNEYSSYLESFENENDENENEVEYERI